MNEYNIAIRKDINRNYINVDGPKNLNTCYEILKVGPSASKDEIKKSYYKLARILHPDKNTEVNGKEAFQYLNNAYNVVANETDRANYNTTGVIVGGGKRTKRRRMRGNKTRKG